MSGTGSGSRFITKKKNVLIVSQFHWTRLVTMQLPAMEGEMRFQGTIEFAIVYLLPVRQLICLLSLKNAISLRKTTHVYLPCWKSGQSAALDITVTSSLQPNIISHAAEKSGYAIEAAEDRKYAQYENCCAQQRILFVPLAIEVLGGLSRTLKKALLRMSLLADSRNYQSVGQSIAFDRAVQSLSVVIIRGSANMLLSRAP